MTCFRDRVYKTLAGAMKDATLTLIDKEREGEQIDRALGEIHRVYFRPNGFGSE